MKIVIGDLHGQYEVVEAARKTGEQLIFVGDYFDAYTRTAADCHDTFVEVMNLVHDGQAIALRGNHEMSYLHPQLRCSGWNYSTAEFVEKVRWDLENVLLDYVWEEGFLISHAGVSQRLLDYLDCTLEEYLIREDFSQIGKARGGLDPIGGLWWCDWQHEFSPIEGVDQIVGHTHGENIRFANNSCCIDCLNVWKDRWNVLVIEEGYAEVVDLRKLV